MDLRDRSIALRDLGYPNLKKKHVHCTYVMRYRWICTIDRSHCGTDGLSCTIDHPWPSIDACTVRHVDD